LALKDRGEVGMRPQARLIQSQTRKPSSQQSQTQQQMKAWIYLFNKSSKQEEYL
jgi:hypothetical protein